MHAGIHTPLEQTPPGSRQPPEQTPPRADPPGADTPQGADTPREWTPPSPKPPRSRHSPHRACWEIRSMRGQYASYWNAILCFYRCVSVHRGGLPQCMLGYTPLPRRPPSQGAKETPLPRRPAPTKETPSQGAKETPPPGPHPGGEIEGDQVQAHTQGGH